ncbi:hypothetical protein F5B20DRAFT_129934 [Whalleya microplaca]|nr:hypothetical protein F5B20DRAFT_129934 [Whalleya microplaca]
MSSAGDTLQGMDDGKADISPWTSSTYPMAFDSPIYFADFQSMSNSSENPKDGEYPSTQGEPDSGVDTSDDFGYNFALDPSLAGPSTFAFEQHLGHLADASYQTDDVVQSTRREPRNKRRHHAVTQQVTRDDKVVDSDRASPEDSYHSSKRTETLSPSSPSSPTNGGFKYRRDRERNRVAAHKSRDKAKHNLKDLEQREKDLCHQNKLLTDHAGSLREEVLCLKNEILNHGGCDSDVIQNYIAKAARNMS